MYERGRASNFFTLPVVLTRLWLNDVYIRHSIRYPRVLRPNPEICGYEIPNPSFRGTYQKSVLTESIIDDYWILDCFLFPANKGLSHASLSLKSLFHHHSYYIRTYLMSHRANQNTKSPTLL
ncbi:hypothetical protein BC938DRAFT_475641 [Jimgerdemannia flammicorona]|uniref:Uncharacterized protein n=1 Tax=Jimgerdemannia flammicorona TaxID=994334 RepID=A0A433PR80_9FUNG|nr:hypothetical protein BC938DRAFT_475641 [Jimgerdemannia flammicorona]